ncbi:MAG: hypothetical protein K2X73_07685 [Sphingomonas sp.]|uniref:hypothetical protein n=1 Tax=Sphingomonas sp. TaxID=28214 RepID=UPI0025FA8D37|nr:hypothetical protein [Sphingomonas sp.]MBX9881838.1 hypothetical protein [Sphingomonas sp.]
MARRARGASISAMAVMALTACAKPAPSGQVLVDVDGTDITRRDLVVELQSPEGRGVAPAALIERLIDRRLLAAAARNDGLDQSPDYLGQVRRQRELLLAQIYIDRIAQTVPPPTAAAVATYIARHPQAFAERRLIDALRLTTAPTPVAQRLLRAAPNIAPAAAALARAGQVAKLEPVTFDSAAVPPATFAALAGSARPVFTDATDRIEAIMPLRVRPAPLTGAAATDEARRALTTAAVTARIAERLQTARARARIRRQSGRTLEAIKEKTA